MGSMFKKLFGRTRDASAAAAPARQGGVTQWKRQVTVFAMLMILLVLGVAGTSGVLMWRMLRDVAAVEREGDARMQAATATRLAILEVDRLLMQTIALTDSDKVRASAVASIAAASKLEDAITALKQALPANAEVDEMARLVDSVKPPRMKVVVAARKRENDKALEMLAAIADPLKRIDDLSSSIQNNQSAELLRAAQLRDDNFRSMLMGLAGAACGGVLLGLVFYWRLMKRLARTDEVERLLGEVHESAQRLDSDGRQLAQLNGDMRQANEQLSAMVAHFRDSFGAMGEDSRKALAELESLTQTCHTSMATSRQQAGDANVVAQQVKATVAQMHGLQEVTQALGRSRNQIASFTESIARISSTTRLLSMNAAVEAARAGEAGRGFNVVAQSIRRLSEDTQTAAVEIRRASDDINQQLASTEQSVSKTRELMDDCAARIAALESSAAQNRQLIEAMSSDVQGFRTSFERQTGRVREMDGEVGSLDGTLQAGHSHAQLLDGTANALSDTSSRMLSRLASVMQ
ncbi:methyl-accepting chemotaxis protein [Piscinibacter terrae]|uniref:Methyl-accepting chemotaxis protein n=1 Tax=Piscinibacter terrae TaxID=2496871 RepID=A0A3N7HQ28_9BURK|nr:methyl-accepting chemotaxis protein [Albitalea terrae]RQP23803.1 methyl-accepting chemotaxis protein [Albitalea terrae]